jgi:hypothetical protein
MKNNAILEVNPFHINQFITIISEGSLNHKQLNF